MQVITAFGSLLDTLDRSPLFPWGSNPTLWGISEVGDDGFLALPILGVQHVDMLLPLAEQWKNGMTENAPVDWMCLIEETDRPAGVCREVSAVSRGADFRVFRYFRDSKDFQEVEDTINDEAPGWTALRVVGAVVWPEDNADV